MGLLKPHEKKSLVRIVLKNGDKPEDVEILGFAAKVKQTVRDTEPVLITSSDVLRKAEQLTENVFVEEFVKPARLPMFEQNNPLRKVIKIQRLETMDVVSFVMYEGANNDSSFLYYRYSPKTSNTLSAYAFDDDKKIIEIQFKKQGESYKLSSVSEKGFDVKKAKGAPVIYKLDTNNAVVGVLGCDDSQAGAYPVLYPILFEEGIFKVPDEKPRPNGHDNVTKTIGASENEEVADERQGTGGCEEAPEPGDSTQNEETPDETQVASSDAPTSDLSQTSSKEKSDANTDGPPQTTINYYVTVSGNAQVAVGQNPKINNTYSRNTNANEEKATEDAKNNGAGDDKVGNREDENHRAGAGDDNVGNREDENHRADRRSTGDDEGDRTDNPPAVDEGAVGNAVRNDAVVVFQSGTDVCREVIALIEGEHDISAVDYRVFAVAVADFLQLDPTSLENLPPDSIMKNCRNLCVFLKQRKRLDIIRELKIMLPNGMTGPLKDERTFFQELPVEDRKNLTEAISGDKILWAKLLTELLGVSQSQIGFYAKCDDPAEKIFDKICKKRRLTVVEVYEILVRYGGAPLADEYL